MPTPPTAERWKHSGDMGGQIGNSLCEDDRMDMAKELLKKAEAKGVCIHLPSYSILADKFAADANTSSSINTEIPEGWMGLDIGQIACDTFSKVIKESKTILWNGPIGCIRNGEVSTWHKDHS